MKNPKSLFCLHVKICLRLIRLGQILSRKTRIELIGVSGQTQRKYEKIVGTIVEPAYAICENSDKTKKLSHRDGDIYRQRGQKLVEIDGKPYLLWQIPNHSWIQLSWI